MRWRVDGLLRGGWGEGESYAYLALLDSELVARGPYLSLCLGWPASPRGTGRFSQET